MKIEIEQISKRYGSVVALDDVTFTIPSGSTFGVLGTNGAGKTTLFELLVGHNRPDAGSISVGGVDATEAGPRVRTAVGFLPERVGFPGLLTGREVLDVHARIRRLGGESTDRIEEVLELVDLCEAADRTIDGYSNGMRTRLGLAAALLAEPAVLVLDEPTAGLDPMGVEAFHQLIERIGRERDATVVLSSHVLAEIERLCDAVAILHEGRLCAADDISTLGAVAGAPARVTITPTDPDAVGRVTEAVRPFGDVTVGGDSVVVISDPERVADVVTSLESPWVDSIDIDDPGLEGAFHAAIEGVAEVPAR